MLLSMKCLNNFFLSYLLINLLLIVVLFRLVYLYNVSLVLGGKFFINFIYSSIFFNLGF